MAKPSRLSPMIMGPTAMTLGLTPLQTSGELGLAPMELSPIACDRFPVNEGVLF